MRNALLKDTYREIKNTFGRFLSIFIIVALGVAFFVGLRSTGKDMKITADKYFDDYNLMDIRLVSPMGFNNDDVNAIKKVDGVQGVMPSYSIDTEVNISHNESVIKVISFPMDKIGTKDEAYINRPKLIDGRYPKKSNECVIEKNKLANLGISINSVLRLSSGTLKDINESLRVKEYTVVGVVETPYYISNAREASNIGNGKVDSFIMVPEENFKMEYYNSIFITAKGAIEVFCYDDKYTDIINHLKTHLKNVGVLRIKDRYDEIISSANKKLNDSKNELKDAEKKQKTELNAAKERLYAANEKISRGEKELKDKKNTFALMVNNASEKISDGRKKLEIGEKKYRSNLQAFNGTKKKSGKAFVIAQQKIDVAQREIHKHEGDINNLRTLLTNATTLSDTQKLVLESQIQIEDKGLEYSKDKLEKSKAELTAKKKSFLEGEQKLKNARRAFNTTKMKLDDEAKKLEDSKKAAKAKFDEIAIKLAQSKEKLIKAESDYKNAKVDSDRKISDARNKISDGEEELSNLKKPAWYILDRNLNIGFVDYSGATDRMDAMSKIFPIFFFLIAALVCLTTMTRMVDEQRTYIGTLKAFGYGKLSIALKYILYAISASALGSLLGSIIGTEMLPRLLSRTQGIMYTMPKIITALNVSCVALATSLAVGITTVAAGSACYKELMMNPSALMRPKAPKAGKRILLENIKFIWSRLNFSQKVTARNIFRYKKRLFMTIIGIGGSTALILAGLGLKDSIMSIPTKQFNELYKYNMVIDLKNSLDDIGNKSLLDEISNDNRISEYMKISQQNVDISIGNTEKSVTLIVPESSSKFKDFIKLRVRSTGKQVPLTDKGVVLTEKLAQNLKVGIGDEIYIKQGESKKVTAKVAGITENYVSHYIYMSPKLYEGLYGKPFKFKQVMTKNKDTSQNFENALSTYILKNAYAKAASFTTGVSKNFNEIVSSLNYIVLVIIISAGILAFVVLYNLTNINVSERIREIATIKVLGFYDKEVSAYVYRENMILTMIGVLLGLVLGIFLHSYVIITAEVDSVMFGRTIKPLSYVFASLLTIVFSTLVNFVIYFKLKKIDMIESLKSVD